MDEETTTAPNAKPAAGPPADAVAAATPAGPVSGEVRAATKKPGRRLPWWLWAIVAVVLFAAAAGAHLVWKNVQAETLARAQANAAIDAEKHWELATASLATIKTSADTLSLVVPTTAQKDMPLLVAALETMKTTATRELDTVAKAVAVLPAGEAKTNYVTAVTDARDAITKAMTATPGLKGAPDFMVKSAQAVKLLRRVRSTVNSAIAANNSRKWSRAISTAKKALADCKTAGDVLNKMRVSYGAKTGIEDPGGMREALDLVALERKLTQASIDAASGGMARSQSRYNAGINRYNKAAVAANKVPVPDFLADPAVFRLDAFKKLDTADELLAAAKTYHEKALRASMARP